MATTRKIKRESDLWRYLRISIKPQIGGHWSRIESHATAIGVPDVNASRFGWDVWIELKQGDDANIRPAQYRWIKDRLKEGNKNIWIIHQQENYGFMAIHGSMVDMIKNKPKATWAACADKIWQNEINPKELELLLWPLAAKIKKL